MALLTSSFFQLIIEMEGGYQNDSRDKGNYCSGRLIGTNMGMSAVAVSSWWGRCPSVEEMKNMSQQDAQNFYSWYFDRYQNFKIEDQRMFELSANNTMGNPTQAAKAEQRALNRLGYSVAVDGVRGPKTIAALNACVREKGLPAIYDTVRAEWMAFIATVPTWADALTARMDRNFPPIGGIVPVGTELAASGSINLALIALSGAGLIGIAMATKRKKQARVSGFFDENKDWILPVAAGGLLFYFIRNQLGLGPGPTSQEIQQAQNQAVPGATISARDAAFLAKTLKDFFENNSNYEAEWTRYVVKSEAITQILWVFQRFKNDNDVRFIFSLIPYVDGYWNQNGSIVEMLKRYIDDAAKGIIRPYLFSNQFGI